MKLPIRSLRQLLLLSFGLVMLPILVLLWRSNDALTEMGMSASRDTTYAIQLSNLMKQTENKAVALERTMRQWQVLKDAKLLPIVSGYTQELQRELSSLCELLQQRPPCDQVVDLRLLTRSLSSLELESAAEHMESVLQSLRHSVGFQQQLRLDVQQREIVELKQQQWWFSIGLVSLSLFVAWLCGRRILSPINQIGNMIRRLFESTQNIGKVEESSPAEFKQLEHHLHQLALRLSQLEQFRQTMLRHASHELKTPLASIKEGCSLLSEQLVGDLSQQQMEVVTLLESSTLRLEHLTAQLLDYNTLLQQGCARSERIESQPFFAQLQQQHQLALSRHQHRLSIECEVPALGLDPILLRRILDNLLSNAMAYAEPKSEIILRLNRNNGMVVLACENEGQPIDAILQKSLFDPFVRGQKKRYDQIVGTGLGLSIVAECAKMMGGDVEYVAVNLDKVCFRVHLPAEEFTL